MANIGLIADRMWTLGSLRSLMCERSGEGSARRKSRFKKDMGVHHFEGPPPLRSR